MIYTGHLMRTQVLCFIIQTDSVEQDKKRKELRGSPRQIWAEVSSQALIHTIIITQEENISKVYIAYRKEPPYNKMGKLFYVMIECK